MRKKLSFIWIILILLVSNVAVAQDTSTDVLVNLVKQETDKVKNALTIQIDTKFKDLKQHNVDTFSKLEEDINAQIDSKMQWQLIQLGVGGFFMFLLAIFLSRLLILKQERKNPYYIDYKNKSEELKRSKDLYKSQTGIQEEKVRLESVKSQLNNPMQYSEQKGLFSKFKKKRQEEIQQPLPQEKYQPERTFTKEEVMALMEKQKQESNQQPKKEEYSDLDKMYEEMK